MIFLSSAPKWYGGQSGFYSQLPRHVESCGEPVQVFWPKRNIVSRFGGKFLAWRRSLPARDQSLTWVEWKFQKSIDRNPRLMHHALSLEANLPLLNYWERSPRSLIGTIHFPRELWTQEMLVFLKRLSSAIVLYQKDMAFFESVLGARRIRFVHHGVDTDYFVPGSPHTRAASVDVIYTGQFYRNFDMASRVVTKLAARNPKMVFHFVVPEQYKGQARAMPYFRAIADHPAVKWHAGISSDELLELYQRCRFMLLPLDASGANNAIVEALACGLPVVTTEVGGIWDYGGGTLFPVVPNNDDDGMVALAERFVSDPGWHVQVSTRVREFAELQLAWPIVAHKYLEACRELGQAATSGKEDA